MEDAVNTALTHLDQPDSYVRGQFVDSAFNTVIPHQLIHKLSNLSLLFTVHLDTGLIQTPVSQPTGRRFSIGQNGVQTTTWT